MLIGFDVGGTNARGILMDAATGTILERTTRSSAGAGPVLLQTLLDMVDELRGSSGAEVDGIGLAVAGLADPSGVVRYSPNLPDLIEYPLGRELESASGLAVRMTNDATAGAWAEAKLGAGRGVDDLVFVALGTGIGTGFVVAGHLVLGAHGFAGESGHMVVDLDGPTHRTGQRGPWEYYASGSGLGRMGREAAATGDFSAGVTLAGSAEAVTGLVVAEALANGDPDAARLFDAFCREVARGVANLVMILDPQRVIIGGGLADIGEPLRSGVDAWLRELTLGASWRPTVEVVLAELGADAGLLGAALSSIEIAAHTVSNDREVQP